MSRTDNTKPWHVRIAEHRPLADHDHSDGICDLPADPRTVQPYDRLPHCRWNTFSLYLTGSCCQGCNCRSGACRGRDWAAQDIRKSRHGAKRDARRELKAVDWRE